MISQLKLRLLLLLQAAAYLALRAAAERTDPGPAVCHPDCTKHGNCGEDGHCRCPFGWLGEACEIDLLAPCRQFPGDGHVSCGTSITKSCECYRRCQEYACFTDWQGAKQCHGPFTLVANRACYEREGVPADEQYSKIPEPDEKGVKCYSGSMQGATEVDCSTALVERMDVSLPLSLCPLECSKHGYCTRWADNPKGPPFCRCYRGYEGHACEVEKSACYRKCSGRGKCIDQFCHCKPPHFSIGCTRSKVYPANYSQPSPINFKIYMYELPTQLAYDAPYHVGWQQHDQIYVAYQAFLEQFLVSPVRTEDPSQANLFYIPSFAYSYSSNVGSPQEHMHLVIDHIRHKFPYWDISGGKDHFFWAAGDRGACHLSGPAQDAIKVLHWGMHSTPQNFPPMGHLGHPEYGCFHPLRDVVAVPFHPPDETWLPNTEKLTVEELVEGKERLFFFAGGVLEGDKEYSGYSRQTMSKLIKKWNDTEFDFVEGGVGDEYEQRLRTSRFCFAPYGHGWGNRLLQAMLAGCVPVIVQEHVFHPTDDVLPYETFSLRLTNEDLPHIREVLRGVGDEQYRRLQEGVKRHLRAFSWNAAKGGQAFEYTILSLRRKYMNFKAMYY